MKKFAIRAISGIIYAAVIIICIIRGGDWILAMSLLFAATGIFEFDKMNFGIDAKTWPLLIYDILGTALIVIYPMLGEAILFTWMGIFLLRMIQVLFIEGKSPLVLASGVLGQFYIGIPFALTVGYNFDFIPLIVFALLWLNDSGAYIVGSTMGKHKMSPRISPKKTWEGLIGGLLIAVAGIIVYLTCFSGFLSILQGILLAVTVSVFGTLGDLIESMFKRAAGVKDSGKCIPGHGGILDRVDSYLLAFPAVMVLLYFIHL